MTRNKLKFIDLFAGIGGFHIALDRLGHECVFASELSEELRILYNENHGIECHGDITKIDIKSIPPHDILCAGFPCQTFSKAGNQKGMQEARGKLFDEILKILSFHKPRFFLLENVRNLLTHDGGNTWQYISNELDKLGYFFDKKILSPHHINIPQHRERIFIVGSTHSNDIQKMDWIEKESYQTGVDQILCHEEIVPDIDLDKIKVLETWKIFLDGLPEGINPYRPLWSMEFGATYPLDVDWQSLTIDDWKQYKGMYGYPLKKCNSYEDILDKLPNYVKTQKGVPPSWKQKYIRNNRQFYNRHKKDISALTLNRIKKFKQESWKKFEWNCPDSKRIFSDKLIQFRGSGVRVKKNDYLPSLVTVSTQIPIIGRYMRYIQPAEAAKSQSLPDCIKLPISKTGSFRVLGNMVNVELVYKTASALLRNYNNIKLENKIVKEPVHH